MELTRIYMNKIFMRLKNKTQLFSAQADDHYHTRLVHSLEVASISLNIAKKIKDKFQLDLIVVQKGALLHDIGHTPFGHAGERTLHKILSGKDDCFGYVKEIKEFNIEQGFKHNINSGLLYKESTPYFKIDAKVMDAIIKHTDISYESKQDFNKDKKIKELDYGLTYVISGISELESKKYNDNNPKYIEEYIVSIADEIAQICSDYLDLVNFGDFKDDVKNTELYKNIKGISSLNYRKQAESFCTYLIDLFSNELLENNSWVILNKNSKFNLIIKDFKKIKKNCIEKNVGIKLFDSSKETIIKTLYAFYYTNPLEMEKGIFDSICTALSNIKGLSKKQYEEINNIIKTENKKEKTIKFIEECKAKINDSKISKNEIKRNKTVIKIFVRYIAVYISKMTDNFASEKYKKIVSGKYFLKNS